MGRSSSGAVVDINPMGMFIQTRRKLTMGEMLELRFPSPQGDYDLSVSAEVVRVEPGGVALEFFDLEDWIFQELYGYVYQAPHERALIVTLEQAAASA